MHIKQSLKQCTTIFIALLIQGCIDSSAPINAAFPDINSGSTMAMESLTKTGNRNTHASIESMLTERATASMTDYNISSKTLSSANLIDTNQSIALSVLGKSAAEIVWHNSTSGETSGWAMSGTTIVNGVSLLRSPDWKLLHVADFNGDGHEDYLWRNRVSGEVVIWLMKGQQILSGGSLLSNSSWTVMFTGDLNGDGCADLIWFNGASGETALWLMNGTSVILGASLLRDPDYKIAKVADLNGDGKSDLIWRSTSSGTTVAWLMNGQRILAGAQLLDNADWEISDIGDFNGDGKDDVLWVNRALGQSTIWLMNGLEVYSGATILRDVNWNVKAVADIDGDGQSDLLWTNTSSGQTVVWLMDGVNIKRGSVILNSASWTLAKTADLDADGKADLIWTNRSTGEKAIWLMDGLSVKSGSNILTDTAWEISAVRLTSNPITPETTLQTNDTLTYSNSDGAGNVFWYTKTFAVNTNGSFSQTVSYSDGSTRANSTFSSNFEELTYESGGINCNNNPQATYPGSQLWIGLKWDVSFIRTCRSSNGTTTTSNAFKGRVVGFEYVTTPTGIYGAYKYYDTRESFYQDGSKRRTNWVCWRSKEINRFIKCTANYTYTPPSASQASTSGSIIEILEGLQVRSSSSNLLVPGRFSGQWDQTWVGSNAGTCSLTVSTLGLISGTCTPSGIYGSYALSGTVRADGTVQATISSGAAVFGTYVSPLNASGTWSNSGASGSWVAQHR
jgi:hypothetical protein